MKKILVIVASLTLCAMHQPEGTEEQLTGHKRPRPVEQEAITNEPPPIPRVIILKEEPNTIYLPESAAATSEMLKSLMAHSMRETTALLPGHVASITLPELSLDIAKPLFSFVMPLSWLPQHTHGRFLEAVVRSVHDPDSTQQRDLEAQLIAADCQQIVPLKGALMRQYARLIKAHYQDRCTLKNIELSDTLARELERTYFLLFQRNPCLQYEQEEEEPAKKRPRLGGNRKPGDQPTDTLGTFALTEFLNCTARPLKGHHNRTKHDLSLRALRLHTLEGIEQVPDAKCLLRLHCKDNFLKQLPGGILQLGALTYLDLSKNLLECLPEALCPSLANLRILDVSDNKLKGLPGNIHHLNDLIQLHANDNQLETLPNTMTSLKQLRSLYVANNRLTQFPRGLHALQNLALLIAYNNCLPQNERERINQEVRAGKVWAYIEWQQPVIPTQTQK